MGFGTLSHIILSFGAHSLIASFLLAVIVALVVFLQFEAKWWAFPFIGVFLSSSSILGLLAVASDGSPVILALVLLVPLGFVIAMTAFAVVGLRLVLTRKTMVTWAFLGTWVAAACLFFITAIS